MYSIVEKYEKNWFVRKTDIKVKKSAIEQLENDNECVMKTSDLLLLDAPVHMCSLKEHIDKYSVTVTY